jgi:RNA-directed DNA polymerase
VVHARYFGGFNPSPAQHVGVETGFYLRRFAWTPIVRRRMVAGTAS